MMKVTKTTFNMLYDIHAKQNKKVVMVQRMKKDGTWGKALESMRFGNESDQEVVDRLIKLNGVQFRIAE